VFRCLAASSLLLAASNGAAATRPHYGETMIVEIEAGSSSNDASGRPEDFAEARALNKLRALIGDRLVRLDASGRPQPALAISWEHDAANIKWTFKLRPAVSWHDGSAVTAADVAAALEGLVSERPWSVAGDTLEIEMGRSSRERLIDLELDKADLAELGPAEARRAQQEGRRVWTSAPVELLALQFNLSRPETRERRLREAIARSIDRATIQKVLLQN